MLSVGLVFGPSESWAQQKAAALAQQIQGNWTLVSIYNKLDEIVERGRCYVFKLTEKTWEW